MGNGTYSQCKEVVHTVSVGKWYIQSIREVVHTVSVGVWYIQSV